MDNNLNNLKLDTFNTEEKNRRFTSNIVIIVVFLLVIGLLFTIHKFGEKLFIFIMFVFILLLPIFFLFKSQLLEILPDFLKNRISILDDNKVVEKVDVKVSMPKRIREIMAYIASGLFLIGGLVLIYSINKTLKIQVELESGNVFKISEKSSIISKDLILKFIGALLSFTISGIVIMENSS